MLVWTSFPPQWPILSPPIILTFPRESPCIRQVVFFRSRNVSILNCFKLGDWTQLDAPH
jgi:hypothetical protein